MNDLRPNLFGLYRRAQTHGSSAARAEMLLTWHDSTPLREEVREQLISYTRPTTGPSVNRTIEWLVAALGQQVPKGFVLVGFVRSDGNVETSREMTWVLPSDALRSELALEMLRAGLSDRHSSRIRLEEQVPVTDADLEIEVHVLPGRDENWRMPSYVRAQVDKITVVSADGVRRVSKDRRGLAA